MVSHIVYIIRSNNGLKQSKIAPGFNTTSKLSKGIKDKHVIVLPVFILKSKATELFDSNKINAAELEHEFKMHQSNQDEVVMCIQCDNKCKNKMNKSNPYFNLLDEMFLTTYSECVSNVIKRILVYKENIKKVNTSIEVFEFWKNIINERNHETMQTIIEDKIANILGFEFSAILIVQPGDEILYRFYGDHHYKAQGEIIKFSRNIGITGLCIGSKETIVNNDGKDNKAYRGDVDNVLAIDMNNSVVWPLFSNLSSNPVGVLHLYNNTQSLNMMQSQMIKQLWNIIGNCIDNSNQFSQLIKTIVNLDDVVAGINNTQSNLFLNSFSQ